MSMLSKGTFTKALSYVLQKIEVSEGLLNLFSIKALQEFKNIWP